jgi:anaerobic magnesium-protoporphyrin IX monomethyl ester cyclase
VRILLVQPTPPVWAWPRGVYHIHGVPTELAGLAAVLRVRGHQVRLEHREARLMRGSFDWAQADAEFVEGLRLQTPDLVVFQAPTAAIEEVGRLADLVRATLGNAPLVLLCGPHATALPAGTLMEIPALSAMVLGEGEATVGEIADGMPLAGLSGLVCRATSGEGIGSGTRPPETDLDLLPQPAWDLCDMEFAVARNRWMIRWMPLRAINLRTSRGCPNACAFCAAPVSSGSGVRLHSVSYIMDLIGRAIRDHAVEAVWFEDETFAADEERLLRLCQALQRQGWEKRLKWACCLRADQAHPELLSAMKSAGCIQVEYGFESASDRLLQAVGKNASVAQNLEAARLTHAAGLRLFANMMFGLPGETARDMEQNLKFIRTVRPEVLSVAIMTPMPGTPLFSELEQSRLAQLRWGDFAYLDQPRPGFQFSALSDDRFFRRYRRVQKRFVKPLVLRQILRDAGNEDSPEVRKWRAAWRRFVRCHPLSALRLPR